MSWASTGPLNVIPTGFLCDDDILYTRYKNRFLPQRKEMVELDAFINSSWRRQLSIVFYILFGMPADELTAWKLLGEQPDRGDDWGRPQTTEAEGGGEGAGEGREEEVAPPHQEAARGISIQATKTLFKI